MTITSAVIVQTTIVSMKVPSMAIMPCRTGSFVLAAACAIAAEPRPASLEKTPRATPKRMPAQTAAPAKPPVAAVGEKEAGIRSIDLNPLILVDGKPIAVDALLEVEADQ